MYEPLVGSGSSSKSVLGYGLFNTGGLLAAYTSGLSSDEAVSLYDAAAFPCLLSGTSMPRSLLMSLILFMILSLCPIGMLIYSKCLSSSSRIISKSSTPLSIKVPTYLARLTDCKKISTSLPAELEGYCSSSSWLCCERAWGS